MSAFIKHDHNFLKQFISKIMSLLNLFDIYLRK